MTYKGYEAEIEFDETARSFHGEVVNVPRDVITFDGTSVDELAADFEKSVEAYLALCASLGEQPEAPMSVDLVVSVPPEIRRKIMLEAKREAKTVENFIADALHFKVMAGGGSAA